MFENKTVDVLHDEILNNIDDSYAKAAGYPTYDFTRSFAIAQSKLYSKFQQLIDKLDVDKLQGEELQRYVKQRKGIEKKLKTKSKGIVTATGHGKINVGDLFSTKTGIRFKSLENVVVNGEADVKIESLEGGSIGNVKANSIIEFPMTIQGIISCTNKADTCDGFDEETDSALRMRYYEALRIPATSANKAHYVKWAKEVTGVGDCKVLPLWNGNNTVKIVIIDVNKQPANINLVDRVQDYIDPRGDYNSTWGCGLGQAPIGAYCTVTSASSKLINISCKLSIINNYKLDEVTKDVHESISNYFKDIAFKQNFISFAKVGSIILNVQGVSDYTDLKLNNLTENIPIANEEVPVLNEVSI